MPSACVPFVSDLYTSNRQFLRWVHHGKKMDVKNAFLHVDLQAESIYSHIPVLLLLLVMSVAYAEPFMVSNKFHEFSLSISIRLFLLLVSLLVLMIPPYLSIHLHVVVF